MGAESCWFNIVATRCNRAAASEIWIEDNQLRRTFNEQFCEYVDLLKKMGIRNGRIDQVRKSFRRFD